MGLHKTSQKLVPDVQISDVQILVMSLSLITMITIIILVLLIPTNDNSLS